MDFYTIDVITKNQQRTDVLNVRPSFHYNVKDLAVKGGSFYAYWDGYIWQPDITKVEQKIDQDVLAKCDSLRNNNEVYKADLIRNHSSGQKRVWIDYLKQSPSFDQTFNEKILFRDDPYVREDYSTHRLDYMPTEGSTANFDELFGILYSEEELNKIKWFVGALLCGDMIKIQKFLFLYGGKGTGKGTIINVIKKILDGYEASISLKNLTSGSDFATSEVQEIPCLIDEDCDLSVIQNDTNLLKLTSHEPLIINQKYKVPYVNTFKGLLIAASNERFKVKHIDSGITRRAVVAEPTRKLADRPTYDRCMKGIEFEIPHIAWMCMEHYRSKGYAYYDQYVDLATIEETDHMYSFVSSHLEELGDPVTLNSASVLYKAYLEDIGFSTEGYKRKLKKSLSRYYETFQKKTRINSIQYKNVYSGLKTNLFESEEGMFEEDVKNWIKWDGEHSIFDLNYMDAEAQLANHNGTPYLPWDSNNLKLKDIDTDKLHYVRVEPNHIVIDFDLRGPDGEKSLEENVKAANKFPVTYAEVSKSGQGIHLHYIYDGDVERLSSLYDFNIEIKVFPGKASIRRQLTHCNKEQIAHISTGLPLKEENSRMYDSVQEMVWTEQKIRTAIQRNLRREYHANTKPSIDFIFKILEDAQEAELEYDVSDMKSDVIAFAMQSTNQRSNCLRVVSQMVFKTTPDEVEPVEHTQVIPNKDLWFYDIEVYSNVLIICGKRWHSKERIRLINPTRFEVEDVVKKPLVGFNNLRYDNHIMMGAMVGESNEKLYSRSQQIINGDRSGYHSGAYNLSYLDVYEMSTKKQSLKKWEAELGIKHDEMDHPWDQPLPEELWDRAADYCDNDVDATEAVFDHVDADYQGRLILAEISGLPVNSKTQDHTAEIIFEGDRYANKQFVYTDLSEMFPGYEYSYGKSTYKGEDPSEGGLVREKLGVYNNVTLLDIESMHPNSLRNLNFFGKYTKNFSDIVDARLAIKHKDYDKARTLFGGKLAPYLKDDSNSKKLAYALKIAINIVYGMTSAKFPNKFNMDANKDNIVAKRGALFMIDLKNAIDERKSNKVSECDWIHIKTDSIKIINATDEDIQFVHDFGRKYGYTFAHEATYSRMALVTKADYIAQYGWCEDEWKIDKWEAVGARFADPFIFKKLFTKEKITEEDFFVTNTATAPIYLDDQFVGKVAKVYASINGGDLMRHGVDKEGKDKIGFISGTKGYKWELSENFKDLKDIDMDFYNNQAIKALDMIASIGSVSTMVDDIPIEFMKDEYMLPF